MSTLFATDKSSLCVCIFIFDKGNIDLVMCYIQNNLIAPNAISFTLKFIFFVKLIRWFSKYSHQKKCQVLNVQSYVNKIHWELIFPSDISSQNTGVMEYFEMGWGAGDWSFLPNFFFGQWAKSQEYGFWMGEPMTPCSCMDPMAYL